MVIPYAFYAWAMIAAPQKIDGAIVACVVSIMGPSARETDTRDIAQFVLWFYVLLPVVYRHAKSFLYLSIGNYVFKGAWLFQSLPKGSR